MHRKKKHFLSSKDHKRLSFVGFFLFFLFSLLVMQFYKVQIIEGEKWTKEAQAQHYYLVIDPFMRGSFYSNNSIKENHPDEVQPLVVNIPKYHLFIDPEAIPVLFKDIISKKLFSMLLPFNEEKNEKKFFSEFYKKTRSRKLLPWLDRSVRSQIENWWFDFSRRNKIPKNAVFFVRDYKRSYPFGSLLGQVLHTVQEEKDVKTNQAFPTGGLELQFNDYLKGSLGKRHIVRSPKNLLDKQKILQYPEHGANIFLTINHYLQQICEEELRRGAEKFKAKGGWAVLMDPHSGEILALAQYPQFDLTKYRDYFNNPEMLEHTRMHAVTDGYEPGSIFKPITLAICLKANEELLKNHKPPLFSPEEKIPTSNGHFQGRPFPLKDGRVHPFLNMYMAVQKSSNIYMAKLVERLVDTMGKEWYRQALVELFGFGKKTGIEMPSETTGLVPNFGKVHKNGTLEWSLSTPYSLAIGHNILVNNIQMARSFAVIANGGMDVRPTLLRKIEKKNVDGKTEVLFSFSEHIPKNRILSKEITETLKNAMKYTTKIGGTAPLADIMGYTEVGKSGTSEKIINGRYSKKHFLSSFVGFAPASEPRFVLLVTLDEPEVKFVPGVGKTHHGGVSAGSVFREISYRSLQYLGVEPDDPFGYPYGDPRRDINKADWFLEVKQLRQLYQNFNELPKR